MKHFSILDTIGHTPIISISNLFEKAVLKDIKVWIKVESANPGGSIKDRMALAIIEDGLRSGAITDKTTIIEASSGNTGIGLAMVAAVKKINIIVVMPESVSIERRKIIEAYGGQVELTPAALGMKGAIDHAGQIRKKMKNSWISSQFTNVANREIHQRTTAKEIITDFPLGLDYLFAGIGTGGHISGCAKALKGEYPNIIINGVEPDASPILSGGSPAPHKIQGIGAGFVPQILLRDCINNIIRVTDEEADKFQKLLPIETGIFSGISTGANLSAIDKSLKDIKNGSSVLTFCNDTGERYLA